MSKSDAIRDDVSAEEQATAGETHDTDAGENNEKSRPQTEREIRMAEVARQYEEQNGIRRDESEGEEHEQGEQEADEQTGQGERDEEAEEDSDDQREAAHDDPLKELGYYRKPDGKLYTKMKINGEEREVQADQVKAYIQKDLAGDYKLQQAAEQERRLQQMEQLVNKRQSEIQQSLSQQPSAQKVDADEARKQAKAVLEKIWDGDEDAAADALAGYLQQGTKPGVDPEQLLAQSEQRALSAIERREQEKAHQQWQSSVDEGNRALMTNHPDIYEDQRLFDLVNGETARMVERQQSGDPEFASMTPQEMIASAASTVQEWMGERGVKPAAEKRDTGSRQERKRNLKPIPKGISATRKPKGEQKVDTSPAAVIEQMRANRAVTR